MKKSIAIIILLLATLKLGHHLWSDQKISLSPEGIAAEKIDSSNTKAPSKEDTILAEQLPIQEPTGTSSLPLKSATREQLDLNEEDPLASNLSKKTTTLYGSRLDSPHFIHSEQIFQNLPPDTAQKERLLKAAHQVKESLNLDLLIFDADGQTNQGIPFVLYSNPSLDLTALVKDSYQALTPEK